MFHSVLLCVGLIIGVDSCSEPDEFKSQRETLPAALKGFEQALKDRKYEEIFDKWLLPQQAKEYKADGKRDKFLEAVRAKREVLLRVIEECKKVDPTVEEHPLAKKGEQWLRGRFALKKQIDDIEISELDFEWENGKWYFVN